MNVSYSPLSASPYFRLGEINAGQNNPSIPFTVPMLCWVEREALRRWIKFMSMTLHCKYAFLEIQSSLYYQHLHGRTGKDWAATSWLLSHFFMGAAVVEAATFSVPLGQECHPGAFPFTLNNLLQPSPRKVTGSLQCQPNQHGKNCFGWEPSCEARPAQDAPYLSYWSIAPSTENKPEQLLTPKLCDQSCCLMFQYDFCFQH